MIEYCDTNSKIWNSIDKQCLGMVYYI